MGGVLGGAGEPERVEALLSTYLDGRATGDEHTLVERHLEACTDCTRSLTTLRATVSAVREMPKVRAPRSFALPRSMGKRSQAAPWLYPLLRAATAFAAFLFALTVAGDLFLRSSLRPSAPAALAPTAVVMPSEARSAPQPTAPAVASGLRSSAPPATPAPQVTPPRFELAVPGTVTPAIASAAKVAPLTPAEPPLTGEGMGGGGVGPGAAPVAPQPPVAATARDSTLPAASPVASPSPAPTSVVRAPQPQPSADQRQEAVAVTRRAVNPLPIAEGMLAALVLILGVTTWIIRRRIR